jgi:hypothetical protein
MSVFHSEEWMQVLEETYGFKRMDVSNGRGTLPLMEANSLLGGRRGVSLPFTDSCEPQADSQEDFDKLWARALERAHERKWKYVEVRGGKAWLPDAPASLHFYRHNLDLKRGEEAIFDSFDSSVRQAIRRAQKSGLKPEKNDTVEGMKTFYALHCRTRKKHGLPPQPWAFFLNIHKHLMSKGLGVLVLARSNQIAVAGAIFFYGKHAVYKFGASDKSQQELRANNLVMWEAIRWLAGCGCEQLDFGRTSLQNEGLRRYKAGWGTRESTLEYVKYDVRQARFEVDKDRASGWHNKIFSRMPMALLRVAGAVLYPQMT